MQNIIGNKSILDEFYRYKRPKFVLNHIGKGNKCKTVLINMIDISKALNRNVLEILKYFCINLGTTHKFIENNHMLAGTFNISDLDVILHKYIKLYVLCNTCDLPSTYYKIKKTKVKKICTACGEIQLMDNDKLIDFMLKKRNEIDFNINCQNYK